MNRHLHFRLTRLIVAAAGVLLLAGCEEKHDVSSAEQVLKVRVQKPEVKPVIDYEYFTGRVEAPDSLDVRAKVNGYLVRWNFDRPFRSSRRLKDFNFVPGQEVKRDQVLFKIDPRPYQAVYDQALAQINLAKARAAIGEGRLCTGAECRQNAWGDQPTRCRQVFGVAGQSRQPKWLAQQANAESAQLNLDYTDVKTDINGDGEPQSAVDRQPGRRQHAADDGRIGGPDVCLFRRRRRQRMLRVQQIDARRHAKVKSVREGNTNISGRFGAFRRQRNLSLRGRTSIL